MVTVGDKLQEQTNDSNVNTIIDDVVKELDSADCKLPGWKAYRDDVIVIAKSLKQCNLTKNWKASIHTILQILQTLSNSALFYKKLHLGNPLAIETSFTSTYHCEFCIAIFIVLAHRQGETEKNIDILNEL
jgi:hypothetical protein